MDIVVEELEKMDKVCFFHPVYNVRCFSFSSPEGTFNIIFAQSNSENKKPLKILPSIILCREKILAPRNDSVGVPPSYVNASFSSENSLVCIPYPYA